MFTEEAFYTPPLSKRETPPVDAVRGFVFTSGIAWMRQHDVFERYTELMPEEARGRMLTTTATEWVSLEDSLKVYAACDELALTVEEQIDLGRAVSASNSGTVMKTVLALVGKLASPWTALGHVDRIWQRSNRGGAVAVFKTGPRQARLEFWAVPLARSRFFVTSMRGALGAAFEPFCDRYVISEVTELTRPDSFALRAQW